MSGGSAAPMAAAAAVALGGLAVVRCCSSSAPADASGAAALARLREHLHAREGIVDVRGRGLILAVECDSHARAAEACTRALANGVIALLSGDDGRVVSLTPPLGIEPEILDCAIDIVADALA